jgi:release factor glutamine methyltransferase
VPQTLAQLLDRATAALGASESPRLDAELLLAHAIGCDRSALRAFPERSADPAAAARFESLLTRRAAGEPVAYLLGRREFWSLPLSVSPAVLVPRPETETLVELAIKAGDALTGAAGPDGPAARPLEAVEALDLGTGSGAIALALKRERPAWRIAAVERSLPALAIATGNGARLGLAVEWLAGDWFEPVAGRRFDLIVSNPPYVAAGDPHLAALAHEPASALVSGHDGLDALRAIVARAPAFLAPGGSLLVEHGADQGEAVRGLLARAGFSGIETATDGAGRPRVGMGTMPPHGQLRP